MDKTHTDSDEQTDGITLSAYQEFTEETAIYPDGVLFREGDENEDDVAVDVGVMYCALGLNGEAGEVAEKAKKNIRDGAEIDPRELGDVFWYLTRLCTELGIDVEDVVRQNVEKLSDRKARDVLGGSGDNR